MRKLTLSLALAGLLVSPLAKGDLKKTRNLECAEELAAVENLAFQPRHFKGFKLGPVNAWKAKVLNKIWKKEINEGDLPYHDHMRPLSIFYAPSLLGQLKDLTRAMLTNKPYQYRFVSIPSKFVASTIVRNLWGHVFLALSLGGSGVILDSLHLNNPNALADEKKVARSLTDADGIAIIVKFQTEKPLTMSGNRGENFAIAANMDFARELVRQRPDKYHILDLSADAVSSGQQMSDKVIEFERSLPKNSKIRVIYIVAHGTSGTIAMDGLAAGLAKSSGSSLFNSGGFDISVAGLLLFPLMKHTSPETLVDVTSCSVAETDQGKQEVISLGKTLLPFGGEVRAYQASSIGGDGYRGALRTKALISPWISVPFGLLNPALAETSLLYGYLATMRTERLKVADLESNKGKNLWQVDPRWSQKIPPSIEE